MPSIGTILVVVIPLLAFAALAFAFAVMVRRASRALTLTRQREHFRRTVEDLAGRIDRSLGAVIERIDAVRRHQAEAASIVPHLEAAADAVDRYAAEAAELRGPVPADEVRAHLLDELGRAGRALEMVAHGCVLMERAGGRHREAEAQTAIKRGYLNALHAREAIAGHADDLAASRTPIQRRWRSARPR